MIKRRDRSKTVNWRTASREALRELRAATPEVSFPDPSQLLEKIRAEQAARDRTLLGKVRAVFFKGTRASEEKAVARRLAEITRGAQRLDFAYPLVDPKDLPAPPIDPPDDAD